MTNPLLADLIEALRKARSSASVWPMTKYAERPVDFARDVLGFDPWSMQRDILNAIAENDYVTVRSGHRVGKSGLDAVGGLWWYGTRRRARVFLTAPSAKQIGEVSWQETRARWLEAKDRSIRGLPNAIAVDGQLALRHDTGLRAEDGRQITGIAPENDVRFQGLAGENVFFIADEASAIPDPIFVVILANLAGGGKLLMTGNPNYAKGYFYDSFKSDAFVKFHVPSTSSPNVTAGKMVIKGLATTEWCAARAKEWGVDSALYKIRVLGEFVEGAEGKLFPLAMIAEAERRWADTQPTGRLVIGVDPAGSSGDGDESGFACRRGRKITRIHARRGLTEGGHLAEVIGLIREERGEGDPFVVIDRDGEVGSRVYAHFCAHVSQHPNDFRLVGMKGMRNLAAQRQPDTYNTMRDELWYGLREWIRDGGALPEDLRLAQELGEVYAAQTLLNRETVTNKDDLRKVLNRSPDRADAVVLACWEPSNYAERALAAAQANANQPETRVPSIDPYGGGGMDP